MNGVVLLLALATPTVDYGWRMTTAGDVECIVQLEPALLAAMADGETRHASVRDNSPGSGRSKRFLLQVGSETLPRDTIGAEVVQPATYRDATQEAANAQFENASYIKYGWRPLDNGDIECLIRIDPRLAQAVLAGRASKTLIGGPMPETTKPLQFVVQVDSRDLPRDAVAASELVSRVAYTPKPNELPPAPRSVELALADAPLDPVRTVFETQLQLRRGQSDTSFDLQDTSSNSPRGDNVTWSDRGTAGGTISDSGSSRYGGNATPTGASLGGASTPSRYGGTEPLLEPPAPAGGGLKIRYGDEETTPRASLTDSTTDTSRYAATPSSAPYIPPAPSVAPSTYAAERARDEARTPLGSTGLVGKGAAGGNLPSYDPRSPAYDPRTDPRPDPRGAPYDPRTDPRSAGYDPRTAYDPRGIGYDPRAGMAAGLPGSSAAFTPRVADRGGYGGPFQRDIENAKKEGAAAAIAAAEKAAADKAAAEKAAREKLDAEEAAKSKDKAEAEPQWVPLVMTFFALLVSLSGNAYLGHMAWGIYRRYRALTDDMRAAPDFGSSSYDDDESGGSSSRRRRRRSLVSRY